MVHAKWLSLTNREVLPLLYIIAPGVPILKYVWPGEAKNMTAADVT